MGLPVHLLRGVHGAGLAITGRVRRSVAVRGARRRRFVDLGREWGHRTGICLQRGRSRTADAPAPRPAPAQRGADRSAGGARTPRRRRGARALRAGPARPARAHAVGDRAQGRARRAPAARATTRVSSGDCRGRGCRPNGAQRGSGGGQRLPPADARGGAHGRAHGVVGRRYRGRRRACRGLAGPRDRGGPGVGRT